MHKWLGFALLLVSFLGCRTSGPSRTVPTPAPQLPFVGADKRDPWGFPIRTADKLVIRKMLWAREFQKLTQTLEAFQAISDADCAQELVGLDAFESFESADPQLKPLL